MSKWEIITSELNTGREGPGATALAFQGSVSVSGGSTQSPVDDDYDIFIYVAGGRPHAGGDNYLDSIERAMVLEDGDLGTWEEAEADTIPFDPLSTPRAFYSLLTSQPKAMSPFFTWPDDSFSSDPIYLFAVAGDDGFTYPGINSGVETIEAALVDPVDGSLLPWVEQINDLSLGRRTYANGGTIIDQYLYCFPGVDTEQAGLDPQNIDYEPLPLSSESTRFPIDLSVETQEDLLGRYQASNGGLAVPRSYYGSVRVNAHVYIVGGNDGTGPIGSVESIAQ